MVLCFPAQRDEFDLSLTLYCMHCLLRCLSLYIISKSCWKNQVCFTLTSWRFATLCNVSFFGCFHVYTHKLHACMWNYMHIYIWLCSRTHLNCMHLIESLKLAGAFAIKRQSTWALYVLYACPYSVSITRNVRPVGEWIYCFQVILYHLW
jgi:hypothetical protein